MLDDFGNELETTESKIDSTMKKMAKMLHMNNGKLISTELSVPSQQYFSIKSFLFRFP